MKKQINFTAIEARAKKMTLAQLQFAIRDCREAATAVGDDAIGKDANYYRDEASVYFTELNRRIK